MLPHLGVHGGREEHRTPGRQQGRGQQIVGAAGRRAGQQIGRGRCDHNEVRLLTQTDVGHLGYVGEHSGAYPMTGQCLEGGGADEAQCRFGGDHPNVVTAFAELAHHRASLVGRDAAGHADDDPLGAHGQTRSRGYSPSVCSRRSPWISRSAIDSGFSCRPGSTSGPTYSRMPSPSWL